jgi:hypothetical protein
VEWSYSGAGAGFNRGVGTAEGAIAVSRVIRGGVTQAAVEFPLLTLSSSVYLGDVARVEMDNITAFCVPMKRVVI